MTEQITLVCLWDSPRMKSCTATPNINCSTGTAIPTATALGGAGRGPRCTQAAASSQPHQAPAGELSLKRCFGASQNKPGVCLPPKEVNLGCFSSLQNPSVNRSGREAAASAPACLHDAQLLTNLAVSEFPLLKMEIIIPPHLRGLVNVYTAL